MGFLKTFKKSVGVVGKIGGGVLKATVKTAINSNPVTAIGAKVVSGAAKAVSKGKDKKPSGVVVTPSGEVIPAGRNIDSAPVEPYTKKGGGLLDWLFG